MSGLRYLLLIKWKAFLRDIFRRPLAAAFTVFGVVAFGCAALFLAFFGSRMNLVSRMDGLESFFMKLLGYIGLIFVIQAFQKQSAMVNRTDAFYLFSGPFGRKQVLSYVLFDMVRGCLFYGCITAFTMGIVFSIFKAPLSLLIWSVIGALLLFYLMFAGNALCYLLEAVGRRGRLIRTVFVVFLLALTSLIFMLNYLESGSQIQDGMDRFMTDRRFHLVPVFGWLKYLLVSVIKEDFTGILTGFLLLLGASFAITCGFLGVKGDFCERAVEDAEWMAKAKENVKRGKDAFVNPVRGGKVRSRWRNGAWAVMSKSILEMQKTNSWIRKQELFLIVFYLIFAKFSRMPYSMFQNFILIVVFISVTSDSMKAELNMHYIYMIPDQPVKKVFSLVAPALLKTGIIVVCGVIPAAVLYRITVMNAVSSLFTLWGYGVVFVAGNIWSIKILKSGNNSVAEQLMKMLIIFGGSIPAIVITVFLHVFIPSPALFLQLAGIVTMVVNLGVGLFFIAMAKGIFEGNYGMVK